MKMKTPVISAPKPRTAAGALRRSANDHGGSAFSEPVADAPNGLQQLGPGRVALDLRAQAVDVAVDGVLVAFVTVSPDGIEQRARSTAARVLGEMQQQIELLVRELDRLTRI
jgi:hypothetical protein